MFRQITRTPVLEKHEELKKKPFLDITQANTFLTNLQQEDLVALSAWDTALWISLYMSQYGDLFVDKNPFNFYEHRYLIPMFQCQSKVIAIMKAAQMGLTTWMILKLIHFLLMSKHPCKAGIYFPTEELANKFAKDRFSDFLTDNPAMKQKFGYAQTLVSKFKESQTIQRIGPSSLYINYMGGKATQDSTPFDALALDEVRLMEGIDDNFTRLEKRLDHSLYKVRYFVSTAGIPEQNIHKKYLEGTQNRFHSKCGCGKHPQDWVVLSDHFPDCIVKTGRGKKDYGYVCPKCNYQIYNPQNGEFVKDNPESDIESFHIHQMLAAPTRKSAYQILSEYFRAEESGDDDAKKEFWNGTLGLPYLKKGDRVDEDVVKACEDEHIVFGLNKKIKPYEIGMGIDQRSGENHVVIIQRLGSRYQIIHMEVVDQLNPAYTKKDKVVSPFVRCCELMELFHVNVCICDKEPNTNDAMAFGREFPGQVWLSKYGDFIDQPVLWSDRPSTKKKGATEKPAIRKSKQDIKYLWTVKLHRYQTIERTLKMFKEKQIVIPNSNSLWQYIRDKQGRYIRTPICRTVYYKHLISIMKETSKKKNTGETVTRWINVGKTDPHFLHATNYALIAMERVSGFAFSFVG